MVVLILVLDLRNLGIPVVGVVGCLRVAFGQ